MVPHFMPAATKSLTLHDRESGYLPFMEYCTAVLYADTSFSKVAECLCLSRQKLNRQSDVIWHKIQPPMGGLYAGRMGYEVGEHVML